MKRRKWAKWSIAITCVAIFGLIALFLEKMAPLDNAVYTMVARAISPTATTFLSYCTAFAGPIALSLITFALIFTIKRKEYRIPMLLNLIVAILLNLALKSVFTRVRPTDVVALAVETGYSFPSGHTMAATCFYGFLIYLVSTSGLRRPIRYTLIALLSAVIALVGFSRVYLGVHFFSDVLGGLCVSIAYLIIFTSFVGRFFAESSSPVQKHVPPSQGAGSVLHSFAYAFEGIMAGLKSERNMVIHFGMMAMVVLFGAMLHISGLEWIVCVVLFGFVVMAELINTAVETIVDMVMPDIDPRAKLAKDTAAGAVLVAAIAAAIAGAIIFLPKLYAIVMHAL